MTVPTSPRADDAPHSSDDHRDTIASSPTNIVPHAARHSTTMFPNSDDTLSSGLEELASAHAVPHPSSEYAISPRVSTVGTDDSHGHKPQFSVAQQIIQDFSAPGLDSLHWAGVQRQRGDFDQRSVASSMNAEKDAASVYEMHLGEDEVIGSGSVRRVSAGGTLTRRDSMDHGGTPEDGGHGGRGGEGEGAAHEDPEDGGGHEGGSRAEGGSSPGGPSRNQVSVDLRVNDDGKAVMSVVVEEGEGASSGTALGDVGAGEAQDVDADDDGMQPPLDLMRKRTMTLESSAPDNTDDSEGGRGSDDESEEELPESPSTNWVVSGGLGLVEGHTVSADEEVDRSDEIVFHPDQAWGDSQEVVEELSLAIGGLAVEEGQDVAELGVASSGPTVAVDGGDNTGEETGGAAGAARASAGASAGVSAGVSAGTSETAGPSDAGVDQAAGTSQPIRVNMGPEWEDTFKGLLYEDGMDALGRPVIVLDADAIPPRMRSSAVTYVRTHLDPIVNAGDYVIVFTAKKATLPTFWILGAYQSLPRPFRKNVQFIILVKPSGFLRAIMAFMRPFVSAKAARKIKLVESVEEIEVATEREVTRSSLGSYPL